ncbi:glycosyltransferase involved in cell wall biosynthesis [Methanofollis sp. W23]|uniref:glycosyltransferase family 2 protein n=1 Tax=Methanofollis sp. W23 TaxID=2817849 RepID=UPI001AE1AE4D|nr:glycosyltransferase family A protein [Methanofollis sp. W23]MBP2146913.1 glycosyltransferase involved in cell wall biosynthesis [Methanofollis sp. W23]
MNPEGGVPGVSVVVPLYNKGRYIGRALRSVLSQTFPDFEVIVVDDGSTDGGDLLVGEVCDPRVRLVTQDNRGVSAARNRGVSEARAGWIAFLDADDEWMPVFLANVMRLREVFPGAGAYATAWMKVEQEGGERRPATYRRLPPPPWEGYLPSYFLAAANATQPVISSAVMVPREVILEVGGFPEDAQVGEDLTTWFRIALTREIVFTWEYGAVYHMEAANRTTELGRDPYWTHNIIDEARKALKEDLVPEKKISEVKEFIAGKQLYLAASMLNLGMRMEAQEYLKACVTESFSTEKMRLSLLAALPTWAYFAISGVHQRSRGME